MTKGLYFDYNATTPLDPRVLEAMMPYFTEHFGNSMSLNHEYGWAAESAVEKARATVAGLINCRKNELTWTSGATESNNWAIRGIIESIRSQEGPQAPIHILSSAVEHSSVLNALEHARDFLDVEIDLVPTDSSGRLRIEDFQSRLKPHTRLLCMMWVQNEVGTIFPAQEMGEFCHKHQIYFLCDGTQALGKIPVDLSSVKVDLLSFSAHKLYGPKGIGFLYHRRQDPRVPLVPLLSGGGHENGQRSGTLNVPGIVGLAKAFQLAHEEMANERDRLRRERDRLWRGLTARLPGLKLNGPELEALDRVPHNLNFSFPVDYSLPPHLPGLAFSRGSACYSGKTSSSHVLRALGLSEETSQRTLRLGLGRMTRSDEVDQAIEIISKFSKKKDQ